MRAWILAALGAAALSACEDQSFNEAGDLRSAEAPAMVAGGMNDGLVADREVELGRTERNRDDGTGESEPADSFLAYRYNFGLRAPAEAVSPLVQAHQDACEAAGPSVCQIINANINEQSEDRVSARLMLRARPEWLSQFRAGLESDAEDAGGEVVSVSQSVEDLTRPILDTEARLSAQVTLRERLLGLLERQGASVEELIRVERELARVNGDIESATAQLRAMRARVSMSIADLTYQSEIRPISQSTVNPVAEAFRDFAGIVLTGLAGLIRVVAVVLPWLIVIIPAVWLFGRWRRSVNRRKAAEKAKA